MGNWDFLTDPWLLRKYIDTPYNYWAQSQAPGDCCNLSERWGECQLAIPPPQPRPPPLDTRRQTERTLPPRSCQRGQLNQYYPETVGGIVASIACPGQRFILATMAAAGGWLCVCCCAPGFVLIEDTDSGFRLTSAHSRHDNVNVICADCWCDGVFPAEQAPLSAWSENTIARHLDRVGLRELLLAAQEFDQLWEATEREDCSRSFAASALATAAAYQPLGWLLPKERVVGPPVFSVRCRGCRSSTSVDATTGRHLNKCFTAVTDLLGIRPLGGEWTAFALAAVPGYGAAAGRVDAMSQQAAEGYPMLKNIGGWRKEPSHHRKAAHEPSAWFSFWTRHNMSSAHKGACYVPTIRFLCWRAHSANMISWLNMGDWPTRRRTCEPRHCALALLNMMQGVDAGDTREKGISTLRFESYDAAPGCGCTVCARGEVSAGGLFSLTCCYDSAGLAPCNHGLRNRYLQVAEKAYQRLGKEGILLIDCIEHARKRIRAAPLFTSLFPNGVEQSKTRLLGDEWARSLNSCLETDETLLKKWIEGKNGITLQSTDIRLPSYWYTPPPSPQMAAETV